VLIDTGPIVALLDADDRHHRVCVETFKRLREAPFTTWPVLTEAGHLLAHIPGAVLKLLTLVTRGAIAIASLTAADLPRISELLETYDDLPADFADATLVRVAERERIAMIFTLDRDFQVYRLYGRRAFKRVPR
jgi:uncharacterized protein